MSEYINYETQKGYIKTILSRDNEELESVKDNIYMNTDISESKLEKMFEYIEENNLKVGVVADLKVYDEYKGQGQGKKFMDYFKSEIMPNTDVDILLARTKNIQNKGFVLEDFYNKYGFKSVVLEDGDLLMVSKGFDQILENILNLKEERKNALNWFKDNGVPDKHKDVFDFMKKKSKENEPKKEKKRRRNRYN